MRYDLHFRCLGGGSKGLWLLPLTPSFPETEALLPYGQCYSIFVCSIDHMFIGPGPVLQDVS